MKRKIICSVNEANVMQLRYRERRSISSVKTEDEDKERHEGRLPERNVVCYGQKREACEGQDQEERSKAGKQRCLYIALSMLVKGR